MRILSLVLLGTLLSVGHAGAGAAVVGHGEVSTGARVVADERGRSPDLGAEPRVVRPRADLPQIPHVTPGVPGPVPIPQVEPAKPGAVPMPEVGGPDPRTLLVPAPR